MAVGLLFTVAGYLSGSVLYARLFGALFQKKDCYLNSPDQNPGTANAFLYGGFWCGALTLAGDLLKGLLPVFFYCHLAGDSPPWMLAFVLAAPVMGHLFPLFFKFRGGKGVATSFGCLLGLFPYLLPVLIFGAVFILLSLVFRINPHFYRIFVAFPLSALLMVLFRVKAPIWVGFLAVSLAVCLRLHLSKEKREKCEVKILWMR